MIAAPRLATVGMKVFSSQSWSSTTSAAFRPPTSAWKRSGYCVAEWLPQIVIFVMSVTGAPVFAASCEIARLWSSRVSAVNRSLRDVGGVAHRDQRVGVGRVAGHADADVVRGHLVEGLALGGEDRAVGLEQVAALHARAARPRADEQGEVDAVEDLRPGRRRSRRRPASGTRSRRAPSRRPRAPSGPARSPAAAARSGGRTEQRPAREPEQQAVADLAGGAGDGDLERGCAHGELLDDDGRRQGPTPSTLAAERRSAFSRAGMLLA